MEYLRKFTNDAAYEAATLNYPSVSLIESTMEVKYDPTAPAPSILSLDIVEGLIDHTIYCTIQYENGMTWEERVESEYNTYNWRIHHLTKIGPVASNGYGSLKTETAFVGKDDI